MEAIAMVEPQPWGKFAKGEVRAWSQKVILPTYEPGEPEELPLFLEKRVYQGSSGKVYPLRVIDRIGQLAEKAYEAIFLENEYLFVMILPEIGGRIHRLVDKVSGHDLFYFQPTIKPALVGLAGPWISGGVEFNWPQHHRPSTFMPCQWVIEEQSDGSKIAWLSEHEPMNRMKGMHGVCLSPSSAVLEVKAKLFNRTPFPQTFLWWANLAVEVHEDYQSFFPPDVQFVADHAKRSVTTFPGAEGHYYGVPYGERAIQGVPEAEMPAKFPPRPEIAPNRLDWYANIPVPTSYMVINTEYSFFGGYDHAAGLGFVHVADRRVSPGKKQWTWGNHEFGYAWDRNLSDDARPYIELMAGVFTENQPDFSFLGPYESKEFSQYWWPLRQIGPALNADETIAISWDGGALGVNVSCPLEVVIDLRRGEEVMASRTLSLRPENPYQETFPPEWEDAEIHVLAPSRFVAKRSHPAQEPLKPATEPPAPGEVGSNDELYWIGTHLEQYRHPSRSPLPYWHEALRRDPGDTRCHTVLARHHLRHGQVALGRNHAESAVAGQTRWNPNPPTGDALMILGHSCEAMGDFAGAQKAFGKATWNLDTKAEAAFALARLACRAGEFGDALTHLDESLAANGQNASALCLKAHLLAGTPEAEQILAALLKRDPLHLWALALTGNQAAAEDPQLALDLALDWLSCGLVDEAKATLRGCRASSLMVSVGLRALGESVPWGEPDLVFPSRLVEVQWLSTLAPTDQTGELFCLLGAMLMNWGRTDEAFTAFSSAIRLNPESPTAHRNLALVLKNAKQEGEPALAAMTRAFALKPTSARLLYELHLLQKQLAIPTEERFALLAGHPALVAERDDLRLEYATLLNHQGRPEEAHRLLSGHLFQPWEGGEGVAIATFARSCQLLARKTSGRDAVAWLQLALDPPVGLGEKRHLLANASDIWLELGDAYAAQGSLAEAQEFWEKAAGFRGDFQGMAVQSFSELTAFSVLALRRLGREEEANRLAEDLLAYGEAQAKVEAKIDFFATSLPFFTVFHANLAELHLTRAQLISAQALALVGRRSAAQELLTQVLARQPENTLAIDLAGDLAT